MPDLTPEEEAFFATGELPASLAEQQNAPAPEIVAPPADSPATPPAAPQNNEMADMLRQSLATEQQRYAEAKVRLDALEKQLQEKLAPKIEAPDPNSDPLGNMMHQLQQVNANVLELQN